MHPFGDVSAVPAGAPTQVSVKALEDRRQTGFDVCHEKMLLVQQVVALWAVPLKAISFRGVSPTLDDEA